MVKNSVSFEDDVHASSITHQTVQKSAAISRKSLRKGSTRSAKIDSLAKTTRAKKPTKKSITSTKAAKDRAVKSALNSVARMEKTEDTLAPIKSKHNPRRFFFALLCSGATVAALAAFIHFNMPNISVKVAAMQSGIEATYPTYTPRNYQLSNVVSDKDGKISMIFTGPDNATFTLSEEKSTWDSTALLNNYVKSNYGPEYATLREQGITIYAHGGDATWVNGGIRYDISTTGHALTKEQIRNLVVSL